MLCKLDYLFEKDVPELGQIPTEDFAGIFLDFYPGLRKVPKVKKAINNTVEQPEPSENSNEK